MTNAAPSPGWDYIAKIVSLGDSGTGKSSLTIRLCEGRFTAQHDVTIGVEFGSRVVPVGPPASVSLGINDPAAGGKQQADGKVKSTGGTSPAATSLIASVTKDPHPSQKHMKLSLWDTAGQETYKSITRSYFRGASGALLVFDITRRATFEAVTNWLADLRAIAEDGIVVVLVGNKSDLTNASLVGRGQNASQQASTQENKRQVTREEAEDWCRQNNVMRYVETSAKSGEGVERAFLEVAERIFQNIEAGRYDLNDRRSGVKSAATSGQQGSAGASRTVNLSVNDTSNKGRGGCC